jgi:hypothetical protein
MSRFLTLGISSIRCSPPLTSLTESVLGLISSSPYEYNEGGHEGHSADERPGAAPGQVVKAVVSNAHTDSLPGDGHPQTKCRLICVDLASSGPLGYIMDPLHLLTLLAAVLQALDRFVHYNVTSI